VTANPASTRLASRRRARPGAFTLVELVVSLVILSILMVGMGGALLLSSQAVPGADSRITRLSESAGIADQFAAEVTYAISVTELTPTAITFTVADRDSDGTPETIRYAWSGTAGDPLTRRYNGGSVVDLVEDVVTVNLLYDLRTITEQPPDEIKESAEIVLACHELLTGPADYAITEKDWIGQYFLPSLPAEATAWKVTRVLFMAREHGAAKGITAVQLRKATNPGLPSSTILGEQLMAESDLGSDYAWQEFAFGDVSGLAPAEGLCLVLVNNKKDTDLADAQYDGGGGAGLLTTSSGESGWSSDSQHALQYYVYGTAITTVTPPPEVKNWLRSVMISIQLDSDPTTRVKTAARVLNEPEVTP